MSTRPTDPGRWATDPGAEVVDPGSAVKDTGWVFNEQPDQSTANWLAHNAYLWHQYLLDGDLVAETLNAETINGETLNAERLNAASSPTEGASGPSIVASAGGQARTIVDHLGYLTGQISTIEEYWRGATTPVGWSGSATAGGSGTITDPTAAFPQRHMKLTAPAAGPASGYTLTSDYLGWLSNASAIVIEFSAALTTPITGGSGGELLTAGLGFAGANNFVGFGFPAGTASAYIDAIPGVGADIPLASSTWSSAVTGSVLRARMEIVGSSITGLSAGTYRVRFFTQGVLNHTATFTTDPGSDKFRIRLAAQSLNGIDGVPGWLIGRTRLTYNHQIASDLY